MAEDKTPRKPSVYQFKVTLKEVRPPIWRRFQVNDDITLYKLHQVLQVVMGWVNCHLYEFLIGGACFSDPDPEFGRTDVNARRVRLWELPIHPNKKFLYTYDFSDNGGHEVVLEKILPPAEGLRYPVCLTGARASPPEDCGGVWGYERLLEILRDPQHGEYEETIEWLGGGFNPEAFGLEEINRDLRRLR